MKKLKLPSPAALFAVGEGARQGDEGVFCRFSPSSARWAPSPIAKSAMGEGNLNFLTLLQRQEFIHQIPAFAGMTGGDTMHARFFNREDITSFIAGFVIGMSYGKDPTPAERMEQSEYSKLFNSAGIGVFLAAAFDPGFRINRNPELSAVLGFILGFCLNYTPTSELRNHSRPAYF